jgi:HK97 family phage portal protein
MLLKTLRGGYQAVTTRGALDDYWYSPIGGPTASGIAVTPEIAMKASAVYACVRLISESVGALPLFVYRRLPDGGKEKATSHPLYELLHDEPSREPRQTAFQFKATAMAHLLLRGNAYARIVPGQRGFVDQLKLIHPDRIRLERVGDDGDIIRYQVRGADGREQPVNYEDIFHLTGLSLDGQTGVSIIKYARETVGLTLAAEGYAGRVFSQDATPRGVLQHPGRLSPDAVERLRESWAEKHSGPAGQHRPAVLEEGMKWQQVSMTAEDAQLLAAREFQVIDVARWFNVPLHMLQSQQKSTSWGSGIEQMSLGYVTWTLLPWLKRWEDTIRQQLLVSKKAFFAEFQLAALMRGNMKDRYAAYALGRYWGIWSANDIRRLENENAIEDADGNRDPAGDIYLQPANMVPLGTPPPPPGPAGGSSSSSADTLPSGALHLPPQNGAVHLPPDPAAMAALLLEVAHADN